ALSDETLPCARKELRVGVAVTLFDNVGIQQCAVFKEHISQSTTVTVLVRSYRVRLVKLQPYPLSFHHSPCKGARFLAEVFHGLLWMLDFRCINSDEPHALTALQKKRIAINHTLNDIKIALRDGLIWWIEKGRDQRNDDDTGNGPRPTVTRQFANGHTGLFSTGGTKASS